MDKHSGNSGTFVVTDGVRQRLTPDQDGNVKVGDQVLHRPDTKPHDEGDAPRDAAGKRTDRGADHVEAAKPQPAMPEAAGTPPWAPPAEAAKDATEKTTTRRDRSRGES